MVAAGLSFPRAYRVRELSNRRKCKRLANLIFPIMHLNIFQDPFHRYKKIQILMIRFKIGRIKDQSIKCFQFSNIEFFYRRFVLVVRSEQVFGLFNKQLNSKCSHTTDSSKHFWETRFHFASFNEVLERASQYCDF